MKLQMMKNLKKIVVIAVAALAAAILLLNCFATVPVGSTGILLTFGKVQDGRTLSEGLHLKLPFVQRIVSMDNRVKKLELDTEAFSKDIQTVTAKLAVNYRLDASKSFSLYKSAGTQFEQNIIVPATHEVLKSVCAQYTAEELISKRVDSSDKMRDELNNKLSDMGINVTDFNIIDFDFSDEFISAVEAKQVAEQVKKKAATENETAIAQAEREKQVAIKQSEATAERMRIEAEGRAQSTLIAAEAEANAVRMAADAEAHRLETTGKYVTDELIRKAIAEAWDGRLPTVTGSSANILDLSDLTGAADAND